MHTSVQLYRKSAGLALTYAARQYTGEDGGVSFKALTALGKAFIRASLSTVLQLALSVRVRAYLAARVRDVEGVHAEDTGDATGVMSGVATEDPGGGAEGW